MSLSYTYNSPNAGEATVTGHTNTSVTSIDIPSTVENLGVTYNVTAIGNNAFLANFTALQSVTIGNRVTSIGDDAFNSCSGLTSVTIGNSVTSIGNDAFNSCSGLTSVTIPDSVTSIGSGAFRICSELTSMYLPNNTNFTSISSSTFRGCSKLTSVIIPDSVTSTGSDAFRDCITLAKVAIVQNSGNNLTIGSDAFDSTDANLVVFIKDGSQTFSGSTQTIGGTGAFFGSAATTAFKSYIVNNPAAAGDQTVFGLTQYDAAGAPPYMELTNWRSLRINDGTTTSASYNELQHVVCSHTTNLIGIVGGAFKDFQNLRKCEFLPFSNGVGSLGGMQGSAFKNCTSLTTFDMHSSGFTLYGGNQFEGCTGLTSVTLSTNSSYTEIVSRMFKGCTSLTEIDIPSQITEIQFLAFEDCTALNKVTIQKVTNNSNRFNFSASANSSFKGVGTISELVIYQNTLYYVNSSAEGNNSVTGDQAGDENISIGGATFTNVLVSANVCFPPGTLLSLDQGDVEIQNVDTKKHTLNGKPILFVTKTVPNKPDVVCFEKDAFAPNVPSQRFECSRAHGIEFDGVRKMAEDWVDADQIHFVPNTHKFLYCLLLETHEMMDVYNIRAETLNPVRKVAQMYFAQLRKEKETC